MKTFKISEEQNRRRVFRLRLPEDALLKATIGGKDYELLEVAEYSICVASDDVKCNGNICTGVIHWSDGEKSEFTGEVGRLAEGGRVIWKVVGISTQNIVGEQRQLLATYPVSVLKKLSGTRAA